MTIERSETVGTAAPDDLAAKLYAAAVACELKAAAPVPGTLALSRRYLNGTTLVVAALFIVIGLAVNGPGLLMWIVVGFGAALLLFGRRTDKVTLVLEPADGGTTVTATGTATGRLAEFVDAIYA